MQMIGLARLGRDAELRTLPSGDQVANLSLAFNYGRKDDSGNKPTQWVEGALWGKLAEVLTPFLKKGQQVVVTLDDPHTEEYQGRNGAGTKLVGKVTSIELAGSRPDGASAPAPQRQAAAPRPAPAPAPAQAGGFDDMDDDIPF